jgi:3-oxoacyl-[acyl-carrier protein] reductase
VDVAVVTGAAHGIGKAIAERLARDGFHVQAIDPDSGQLETNIAHWSAAGLSISTHVADCRDRARVAAIMDMAGPIHVVVNNAGISGALTPIAELTREECARVISVNLLGSFRVAQEAARRMSDGGRIINLASRGYLGAAGIAHYAAAKAGVVAMTRAMASELRWRGIMVNAIAPGLIDTRAVDVFGDALAILKSMEVDGKAASPDVIADVVGFLAGEGARFISGQVIFVDGGKIVGMPPL